ncbi:MAG: hypothetical protein KIT66_03750 [Chitinophagaceae bacterium]|nr:hypothetical protein [Chitinophagaceae bacterium]
MESINIEILNPKAMQLIKGMQDLKLIKIKKQDRVSDLQTFLKKTRKNALSSPDLDKITAIVEEVRTERYGHK